MLALAIKSTPVFFLGTAISGVGFGSGFQGGIRTVVPLAAAHERAGVLSLVYIVSYLGLGVPAVVAGFVIVHGARADRHRDLLRWRGHPARGARAARPAARPHPGRSRPLPAGPPGDKLDRVV